jgi:peptidoglycan hydrolase-like protein with peptidoglycan-binding domain
MSDTTVDLGRRSSWQRPRTLLAIVALAVVAVSVYLGVFGWSRGAQDHGRAPTLATVAVTRADVSTQNLVQGTLGYASETRSLTAATAGVVEAVPTAGAKLTRGALLARISGQPAVLLYGHRAAWRTLVTGMAGADVRQLNANLAALGYLSRSAAAGDVYGSATEAAMRRLQEARGAVPTGIAPLGSLVFAPGAIRVGVVAVATGQTVEQGAQLLEMASARRVVSIDLPAADQDSVHAGDAVSIGLPNGQSTSGVVSDVARVATPPAASADSQGGGGPSGGGDATVTVTVRLRDARVAPALDEAPVQVAITTASSPNALAVPVGALLAQADGSYAVQVVRGGTRVTVAVTTGLFSDSTDLVAITGGAIRAGDRVVVPA